MKKKLATVLSELSKNDLSTSEIMMLLKEQNRTRLRKNIINPLLEKGLIAKIILDNQTDPNQKYRLIEKAQEQLKFHLLHEERIETKENAYRTHISPREHK